MSEETANEIKMPARFQPVNVSGQQNWIRKTPGTIIEGILKGRFKRSKGKQHFYQVKVMNAGVPAVFDGNDVILDKGDLVCIDETKALEALQPCAADSDKTYEVFIAYLEKVANPSDPGTSFWRMKVGVNSIEGEDISF